MIRGFAGFLAAILVAGLLAACSGNAIHGVSSADSTNVQGAPGTAGDSATGGQGNRQRFR